MPKYNTWAEIQPILATTHRAYLAAIDILRQRGAVFLPQYAAIRDFYLRLEAQSAILALMEDMMEDAACTTL